MTEAAPVHHYAGLDLATASDFTCLAILRRVDPPEYVETSTTVGGLVWRERRLAQDPPPVEWHLVHLERWRGLSYPKIVDKVKKRLDVVPNVTTFLDVTGVGRPVFDMAQERGLPCLGCLIHGGDKVTQDGPFFKVPKRDLAAVVAVALQNGRLKIGADLKERDVLIRELESFKVEFNPQTAHDSYSAWREGMHDDAVLAVSMALWAANYQSGVVWYAPSLWT